VIHEREHPDRQEKGRHLRRRERRRMPRTCVISSSTAPRTRLYSLPYPPISTPVQNAPSIQKVLALLIPGVLPDFFAPTANPHIPIMIPCPSKSNTRFRSSPPRLAMLAQATHQATNEVYASSSARSSKDPSAVRRKRDASKPH
jgi:hypothetical protein